LIANPNLGWMEGTYFSCSAHDTYLFSSMMSNSLFGFPDNGVSWGKAMQGHKPRGYRAQPRVTSFYLVFLCVLLRVTTQELKISLHSLPKIRHTVCQLSGVIHLLSCVSTHILHLAHWNTHANGANFIINRHNTCEGTLDFY